MEEMACFRANSKRCWNIFGEALHLSSFSDPAFQTRRKSMKKANLRHNESGYPFHPGTFK